jgi:prepilin-type N-terminal cleavage/methylation domain-containing protein
MYQSIRKGFTLIEILIVVAIIAILASVVLVGLGPTQQAGRDARRLSDLRGVQTALELYFSSCGFYPGPTIPATGCAGKTWGSIPPTWADLKTVLQDSKIGVNTVPDDPSTGKHYFYGSTDGSTYVIGAQLENKNAAVFTNYTPPSPLPTSFTSAATCAAADGQYCFTL